MAELSLYDYQNEAIEELRKGFANGKRAQVLVSPTGSGKTEMAIALMAATAAKGNKTAMLLDRIVLCNQTSARLDRYGLDHGVYQADHWRNRPYEKIQVCSAQTMEALGVMPDVTLLIIDECFPAGTMISTPHGDKDISIVRCGDTVYNALGVGIVKGVIAKPALDLLKLEFEDGTTISCTTDHPIFTDRGWVKAIEMEIGRVSYSIKGLHLLWENLYTRHHDRSREGGGTLIQDLDAAESLLKILFKEVEKSNEQSIVQSKDEGSLEADKTSANPQRREWEIAASATACFSACIGSGVGVGVRGCNKDAAFKNWISNLLQTGYCKPGDEDWDRVGRWLSLLSGEESSRFEEDRISCFPRLVNISCVQRESPVPVFNLHISGHPSYFANGKLVHNCHTIRTKTAAYIKSNLKLKVIGLTATPFTKGMGKIYDNVVSTVTTKQLVAREVLVPLRVFIAKEIDMEGAKKSGGEWTNSEATARGKKITGDVVAEWIKVTHKIFNRPRKTLVFCSGTEHGVDLARKFQEQGYNFIATSHKDPDEWRKEILREFAEPDSKIHGLIATDLYTKGLDIPDVMIGVSARPFSKSFSSHVQQMGRITRGNPGSDKSFSVWICHSGNYLRFKDDWDEVYHNGVDELDDGKEKTKTEPTEFEKEAAKCPKCHALWAKGSDACYNCGFVREKQNMVYSVNGILTELQAPVIVKCDWDKQEFWSAMVWNMQHKGWKQGRAAKLFKDRFSEYQAPDLKNIPVKPSARIDLFAKNNLIAWQIKQKYLREHGR